MSIGSSIPVMQGGRKRNMAGKKMTMKTAMRKYESSAADKRRDAAGAKAMMKKANAKKGK